MLFDIIDDGGTGLYGTDVLGTELLASKDGIHAPAHCARQRVIKYHVDFAKFVLWIEFFPLGDLSLEDACKVLDGDARVGIGIVDDDCQTVVRDGHRSWQVLTVYQVLTLLLGEVTGGEDQEGLQLHEFLHGILLINIKRCDGVERLVLEIV